MNWIFDDFTKDADGLMSSKIPGTDTPLGKWTIDNLGPIVMMGPLEAYTKLDYTCAPGGASGLYYSLCFQLGKWEMLVQKASESVEVSPMHAAY